MILFVACLWFSNLIWSFLIISIQFEAKITPQIFEITKWVKMDEVTSYLLYSLRAWGNFYILKQGLRKLQNSGGAIISRPCKFWRCQWPLMYWFSENLGGQWHPWHPRFRRPCKNAAFLTKKNKCTCSLKWLHELQHEILVSWLFLSLWESLCLQALQCISRAGMARQ